MNKSDSPDFLYPLEINSQTAEDIFGFSVASLREKRTILGLKQALDFMYDILCECGYRAFVDDVERCVWA